MSAGYSSRIIDRFETTTVDWLTVVLVGLVIFIQGSAIYLAPRLVDGVATAQSTNITLGVGMVAALVGESLALVVVWRLWKHLPEKFRRALKYSAYLTFIATVGWVSIQTSGVRVTAFAFGSWVSFAVLDQVLARFDMDWITFDLLAVGIGIFMTSFIGIIAAPIVIIPILVLTMVWDHIAVNLSRIMGELVEFSTSSGIPNYLMIPLQLQLESDAVKTYIQDADAVDRPVGLAAVIGMGDFIIPGALAGSAYISGATVPALTALGGTVIAMVILRDSMERQQRGLPALPWLNTGALIGFGVGILVAGMSVTAALGVGA